jgi:hypothetical protein
LTDFRRFRVTSATMNKNAKSAFSRQNCQKSEGIVASYALGSVVSQSAVMRFHPILFHGQTELWPPVTTTGPNTPLQFATMSVISP